MTIQLNMSLQILLGKINLEKADTTLAMYN